MLTSYWWPCFQVDQINLDQLDQIDLDPLDKINYNRCYNYVNIFNNLSIIEYEPTLSHSSN